jgi:hypothetical protein
MITKKHTRRTNYSKKKTSSNEKHLRTIKLVIFMNTEILINLAANRVSKITHKKLKSALKKFMDTLGFQYGAEDLDDLTNKMRIILISLIMAYGKPIRIATNMSSRNRTKTHHRIMVGGGAYLEHLIDKGDQPITGNDFKKASDDIAQILGTAMFAPALFEHFGAFGAKTALEILTGNDVESSKSYFKWHLSPNFIEYFPPRIKFDNVWNILKSAENYLNVYFTHENLKKQALREDGKLTEEDLKPSALEKLSQEYFDAKMAMDMAIINPMSLRHWNPTAFIQANIDL